MSHPATASRARMIRRPAGQFVAASLRGDTGRGAPLGHAPSRPKTSKSTATHSQKPRRLRSARTAGASGTRRRRQVPLAPAVRALRSRLGFWLWVAVLFEVFGLLGAWPSGAPRPVSPRSDAATNWPAGLLIILALLAVAGWLITRERLLPRGPVRVEDELAGH